VLYRKSPVLGDAGLCAVVPAGILAAPVPSILTPSATPLIEFDPEPPLKVNAIFFSPYAVYVPELVYCKTVKIPSVVTVGEPVVLAV
jgi:hypothetical protein